MNQTDRKEFEIIHTKIDSIQQDLVELKRDMQKAHDKSDESLKFIKENLFNPHEGLWAETRLNSEFRKNTSRWRGVIGAGFIGLVFKQLIDVFKP
tara:strand:+ start:769 stop:1053 length:285 start_codon:yes stop_codon:yes gene_type:complete